MTRYKHIVLGGGMVADHLARDYIENGGKSGDLAIISSDDGILTTASSGTFLAEKRRSCRS